MKLHKRFIKSLYSIKSLSSFRFLGVGSTILYVLFLTFLSMLPIGILFIVRFLGDDHSSIQDFGSYGIDQEQMHQFVSSMDGILPIILFVIYIAMYVLLSGLLFTGITVLSGLGLLIVNGLQKRTSYKHLWVMASYSFTLPVVLLTLLFLFNLKIPYSFTLFWIFTAVLFVAAITQIPAKK
jgi:hypothetical protein